MPTRSPPNILWVSFEDTNPFYACYGDPVARTPNLDRLAAQGCRWNNAFSTAAVCAPARSGVITGMYAASIGAHHMRTTHCSVHDPSLPTPYSTVVPHYVKCFPEYLRARGYHCTNNAKTDYQFATPVTAWDECGPAAHWRNRSSRDQPFFAVFNFEETHESGMWSGRDDFPFAVDPRTVPLPPYFPDTPKVRASVARMYANIERNDRKLGRLLAQLEADGLADNTIVFHWSDHGPLPRGKRWPYDSGLRVPLIVRWPGGPLRPGSVDHELVSTIDLAPTVLSLAGAPVPAHLQGRIFLGPAAAPPRDYVFATRDRHDASYDMVRAVRDRRFKYLRNYYPNASYTDWIPYLNQHPIMQEWWRLHLAGALDENQSLMFAERRPAEELYDTRADPHELRNLAALPEFAPELQRLRRALDEWRREIGDLGDISETEMVRRWYPDGKQPRTAAPLMIAYEADATGLAPLATDTAFSTPPLIQLHCATQGASIAWRFDTDVPDRWRLYTRPIFLPEGAVTLHAKAIRIGYAESPETAHTLTVLPAPATVSHRQPARL